MAKKSRPVWHKGPPPSRGWWPASVTRDISAVRWWDGKAWSVPAYRGDPLFLVENAASVVSAGQHRIEWRARPQTWPTKARGYLG